MEKYERVNNLHEDVSMPERNFPVKAFYYESNDAQALFPAHWHEHIEIIYIVSGNITIECDGQVVQGKKSDIIIINPNELHSCPSVNDELKIYCIIFDTSILNSRYFDKSESQYIQPILNNSILFENLIHNEPILFKNVMCIYNEMQNHEIGYELAIKSCILDIIVLLLRNYGLRVISSWEKMMKTRNNGRIDEVIKYIDRNYAEDITLEQLASLIYVSKGYLCKLFKKLLGKNVIDYVNYVRIKAAEELLEDSSLTISNIAVKVGYNDINYFCRVFKRNTGVSPTEMRNKKNIQTFN